MINTQNKLQEVLRCLVNALKIKSYSLCICGSGKKYKQCCSKKSEHELPFIRDRLSETLTYKNSQGGVIQSIPQGLWKKFENASMNRLGCLCPVCREKTVLCHLIPENILRSAYGGHCLEWKMQDGGVSKYTKEGVGRAGAIHAFCSNHDNDLFHKIDQFKVDSFSKKELFLLAFKAISFSLRRTQYLLGIDFQVELFRPFLILGNQESSLPTGTNLEINIDYLQTSYLRYCIIHDLFKESCKAVQDEKWDYFFSFHRSIKYQENIFYSALINRPHDINGKRLNTARVAINMVCSVYTEDGHLHTIFSVPKGESMLAYKDFLNQLKDLSDQDFLTMLNNIMTYSEEKPLLSKDFYISDQDYQKISLLQAHANNCLKTGSNSVLNLQNKDESVSFLEI